MSTLFTPGADVRILSDGSKSLKVCEEMEELPCMDYDQGYYGIGLDGRYEITDEQGHVLNDPRMSLPYNHGYEHEMFYLRSQDPQTTPFDYGQTIGVPMDKDKILLGFLAHFQPYNEGRNLMNGTPPNWERLQEVRLVGHEKLLPMYTEYNEWKEIAQEVGSCRYGLFFPTRATAEHLPPQITTDLVNFGGCLPLQRLKLHIDLASAENRSFPQDVVDELRRMEDDYMFCSLVTGIVARSYANQMVETEEQYKREGKKLDNIRIEIEQSLEYLYTKFLCSFLANKYISADQKMRLEKIAYVLMFLAYQWLDRREQQKSDYTTMPMFTPSCMTVKIWGMIESAIRAANRNWNAITDPKMTMEEFERFAGELNRTAGVYLSPSICILGRGISIPLIKALERVQDSSFRVYEDILLHMLDIFAQLSQNNPARVFADQSFDRNKSPVTQDDLRRSIFRRETGHRPAGRKIPRGHASTPSTSGTSTSSTTASSSTSSIAQQSPMPVVTPGKMFNFPLLPPPPPSPSSHSRQGVKRALSPPPSFSSSTSSSSAPSASPVQKRQKTESSLTSAISASAISASARSASAISASALSASAATTETSPQSFSQGAPMSMPPPMPMPPPKSTGPPSQMSRRPIPSPVGSVFPSPHTRKNAPSTPVFSTSPASPSTSSSVQSSMPPPAPLSTSARSMSLGSESASASASTSASTSTPLSTSARSLSKRAMMTPVASQTTFTSASPSASRSLSMQEPTSTPVSTQSPIPTGPSVSNRTLPSPRTTAQAEAQFLAMMGAPPQKSPFTE